VDFCSHALVVVCPPPSNDAASTWWSQFMFVGATSLGSASAGVMPAAQSFALSTLQGRKLAENERTARLHGNTDTTTEQDVAPDSGKLFGAIAVLQAISQTILGPIIFGVIYSNTVASFPKAIFAVAGVLVLVAIVLTIFVRPDLSLSTIKNNRKKTQSGIVSRHRVVERRGRSRVSKDLRGISPSTSYGAARCDASISSARTW